MKLSVVIPVFNGEKTIGRLVDELVSRLSENDLEVILVNDGSPDNSHDACLSAASKYHSKVIYLKLAKNFGEHNAVMAGLNHATGEYAVIVDDDFQNPPETIKDLLDTAIRGNYDVVYSQYEKKRHSLLRNMGSDFNDLISNYLLDKPKDLYLSSFKCLSRFVINEIIQYKGPYPYIDGLVLRATRNIGKVQVRHDARSQGRSGYTLRKLVRLWLNMFVNFSIYPLRISTLFGFLFSICGSVASIFLIIDRLAHPEMPVGFTSILVAILVFSGLQLITLGVLGEYIGKQFLTANQTPQYVIREIRSGMGHGKSKV